MYFNELMSISSIISAYRTNTFPDAYCLLTTSTEDVNILSTEDRNLVETENERLVRLNGSARIIIH